MLGRVSWRARHEGPDVAGLSEAHGRERDDGRPAGPPICVSRSDVGLSRGRSPRRRVGPAIVALAVADDVSTFAAIAFADGNTAHSHMAGRGARPEPQIWCAQPLPI